MSEGEAVPIGRGLDRVLRDLGAGGTATVDAVFGHWDELAGPELARGARPVALSDGRLVVEAADPGWATRLRYATGELLAALEARVGAGVVRSVEVRVRRGQPAGEPHESASRRPEYRRE